MVLWHPGGLQSAAIVNRDSLPLLPLATTQNGVSDFCLGGGEHQMMPAAIPDKAGQPFMEIRPSRRQHARYDLAGGRLAAVGEPYTAVS